MPEQGIWQVCIGLLLGKRLLSKKFMEIPPHIKNLINRIKRSENEWKLLYVPTWYYHSHIGNVLEDRNTANGNYEELSSEISPMTSGTASVVSLGQYLVNEESRRVWKIKFKLPASKKAYPEYELGDILSILASRDDEYTLGHLQTLFSLLEELAGKVSMILPTQHQSNFFSKIKKLLGFSKKQLYASNWKSLVKFLRREIGISARDIQELSSAKKTRNCYIHNDSRINGEWRTAYNKAKNTSLPRRLRGQGLASGFQIQSMFHQVEDWHDLVVGIADKIEERIIQS